ncbi:cytochrome P450 [Pengzhenrongella phosphoraccumulans]|uniref:cytochrome P450 n=1 Tax=Pengzhenrongella phosphoraccumulans TaxID=3114394 RepID=UPI00388E9224
MTFANPANATTGCPVQHGYEPFDMKDPFPAYAELRAEEPVMFDERTNLWVVTRYDDVKAVFEDWETFSSENAQKPVRERGPEAKRIMDEGGFTAYSGLSARTPPEHTRIRKVVQRAFTPRRYKAMEPHIRENVAALITEMVARPERDGDIVRDIAYDLPTITILTLFGLFDEQTAKVRIAQFKGWSEARAMMTWGDLDDAAQVPYAHQLVEYWQECQALVAKAHAEHGDNMLGDLVRAQDDGDPISDHEIASVAYSLLFAGHETTTTLISNCVRVLLAHPDQWAALVADPDRIPAAIEEVLRYSGSIVAWRRKALTDAEVGGVSIPAGAELLLVMGSANRDEAKFADGETFDIERPNAREHLSFGFGIHVCVGNMLAKLQARIALEEIVRLAPNLTLVEPEGIDFLKNLSFRVPTAVPVTWEA